MNTAPFKTEAELRNDFAQNLIRCRRGAGLTQAELARQVHYSDKTISKWERAEGMPDLYVTARLAAFFDVPIDSLLRSPDVETALALSQGEPVAFTPPDRRAQVSRGLILLLSMGLCFFVATVCHFALRLFLPAFSRAWLCFLYAAPAACVVAVVFTSLWWKRLWRFISVSALIWTLAACVQITLTMPNIALIYIVAAALQALCALWFLLLRVRG